MKQVKAQSFKINYRMDKPASLELQSQSFSIIATRIIRRWATTHTMKLQSLARLISEAKTNTSSME